MHCLMLTYLLSLKDLVDSLNDVLVLFESLTLVDVDALSDVDVLVESETLVLDDPLNDVLSFVDSLPR